MKRKILLCLLVVALATPALGHGFHRFGFGWWWFRPPADPVKDGTSFDPLNASRTACFDYVVVDKRLQSFQRTDFDDSMTTGAVNNGGQLTIQEVLATNANQEALFTFAPDVPLNQNSNGSRFKTTGNAAITDLVSGDSLNVPLHVKGRITERDGQYCFRAYAFGYLRTDGTDPTNFEVKVVRVTLEGKADVPPDPVPVPVPVPAPAPAPVQ